MDPNKPFLKKPIPRVIAIVIAAAAVIIIICCCNLSPKPKGRVVIPDIKVYIRGEVKSPGLYKISADTRLAELIEIAGGQTEKSDLEKLNLAAFLTDGTTLEIPAIGSETAIDPTIALTNQNIYKSETKTAQTSSSSKKITSGTININTAPASELMKLPGVGQSTANKIIKYRTSSGGFKAVEEIMNVSGIGEKTFEKMKQFITVE